MEGKFDWLVISELNRAIFFWGKSFADASAFLCGPMPQAEPSLCNDPAASVGYTPGGCC